MLWGPPSLLSPDGAQDSMHCKTRLLCLTLQTILQLVPQFESIPTNVMLVSSTGFCVGSMSGYITHYTAPSQNVHCSICMLYIYIYTGIMLKATAELMSVPKSQEQALWHLQEYPITCQAAV